MAQKVDDPRKVHKVGKYTFYDYDGYVDPKILTGKAYGIKATEDNPEAKISFTLKPNTVKALKKHGQTIRVGTPEEFADILQAFVNLRTGQNSPFKFPLNLTGKGLTFTKDVGIGRGTASKFLALAEIAGIYDSKTMKGIDGSREDLDDKSLDDLADFRDDPHVKAYLTGTPKHREENNPQYLRNLYKALKILGFTPYQMLAHGKGRPEERLAWVLDQLEKLKTWSENPDAIDPIQPKRKRKLHPEHRFNPVSENRNNSTMYNFAKSIKPFLEKNGLAVGRQPAESRLSQKIVSHGGHSEQKLSYPQILEMIKCLQHPVKEIEIPILVKGFVDWDQWKTVKTFTKEYSMQSFWNDALLYFLIAIEMGMRAEEGFTIVANPPRNKYASGVTEKKKTIDGKPIPKDENGNNKWYISLYTRKTEHLEAADKIHKGRVKLPMLIELLEKRRKEIDDKHGIEKNIIPVGTKNLITNTTHSLIGHDDKYTRIATIEKSNSVRLEDRRVIVRNIIRHCYLKAVPKQDRDESDAGGFDNFMEMPLHSLRHVFAQYWLHKSDWNFTFVAQLGHWKTEKELKDSYGGMDQDRFDQDYEKFSSVDANLSPSGITKYLANYAEPVMSKDAKKTSTETNPPIEKLKSDDPATDPEDRTPPVPQ